VNNMVRCTVWPSYDNTSLVSDMAAAVEQPWAKSNIFFSPIPNSRNLIRSYISTAKVYGDTQAQVHNGGLYSAAMAADPTNIWYWNVMVTPVDPADALTTDVHVEVKMIFYVEASDLKRQAST